MVGIVVVSHSRALARAAVALAEEMVHGKALRIAIAAGLDERTFGTDARPDHGGRRRGRRRGRSRRPDGSRERGALRRARPRPARRRDTVARRALPGAADRGSRRRCGRRDRRGDARRGRRRGRRRHRRQAVPPRPRGRCPRLGEPGRRYRPCAGDRRHVRRHQPARPARPARGTPGPGGPHPRRHASSSAT